MVSTKVGPDISKRLPKFQVKTRDGVRGSVLPVLPHRSGHFHIGNYCHGHVDWARRDDVDEHPNSLTRWLAPLGPLGYILLSPLITSPRGYSSPPTPAQM